MRLQFQFNPTKTLQAAAVLLTHEGGDMSRMRLLKLLYIADREAIAATASPITGDQPVAMKRGPVLSGTYDLIKGEAGEWGRCIRNAGYKVKLVEDPGRGKLSKGDVARLLAVSDRYRDVDDEDLSEETHHFPEWDRNYPGGDGVGTIPWEDALTALGREHVVAIAERDEADRRYFDDLFGSVRGAGR